jgi:tripartite-type tricarboxylate transporter receptor subunit TctC
MKLLISTSTLALAGTMLLAAAPAALAQNYPNHPIRLIVGFEPGGAADSVARALSQKMGETLGVSVIVENRAGAGSALASDYVSKAAPDGYTMMAASPAGISVYPALNPNAPYSSRDFTPVTKVANLALVMAVNSSSDIHSIKELVAYAKKNPGKLNYATAGNGSAPHLATVLFDKLAGLEMTHVPFKGGGPAVQSVVAGTTDLTFGTSPSVLPMMRAGRLRGLAVSSRNRSALVPELPGMAEAGMPEYDLTMWYGIFLPPKTPAAIVKRVYDAAAVAVADAKVKSIMANEGNEATISRSPEDYAAFMENDNKFWTKLVKDSGAKID